MNTNPARIVLCALAALGGTAATHQNPPQAPPVFTSRVDLLTTEASVFDKDKRPVADLQPSDFVALVDGKPRTVVFARFYGARSRESAAPVLPSTAFVSNVGVDPARIVVFVIDQDAIRSGQEKAALDMASRFVDALRPGDAVGLLPLRGAATNLTRDHAVVREALKRIVGMEPPRLWARNITLDEAGRIVEGERRTRTEVIERECPLSGDSICPADIINQSREMVQVATQRVQYTLNELTGLVQRLKAVRGPKHLVFISGGLPFDKDLIGMYRDFAKSAAEARVAVYTIHLDQATNDASDRKYASFGGRNLANGLSNLASMAGGESYEGVGKSAASFDRIEADINNYYELGIDATPADVDGKPHTIEVKVTRPGLTLRSPRELTISPRPTTGTDEFLELLYQPVDGGDMPLGVATYTMRGNQPNQLSVLVSADIGAGTALRSPVQWGFVVLDGAKVVTSARNSVNAPSNQPLLETVSADLAPGRYRLRVAALDAGGHAGVFEIPLAIDLHEAGALRMSDLFVGTAPGGRFTPAARVPRGTPLVAVAELYARDADELKQFDAQLELSSEAKSVAIPVEQKAGSNEMTLPLQARIATADLAPGRYSVTLRVRVAGGAEGHVSRTIEVF